MRPRKLAAAALALAGTGFFGWLATRRVDFARLGEVLAAADWIWVVPMVGVVCADLLIRAVRWRVLLARARPQPAGVWELLKLEAAGLAINNVLFMRLGELARAGLAAKTLGVPPLAAVASVAVERALDVAALLAVFLAASSAAPGFVPLPARAAAAAALLAAVGALAALAWAEGALREGALLDRLLSRWPRILGLVRQLALGASVLREPSAAFRAAALSLLLWACDAWLYWFGARALRLGEILDYPRSILVLTWAGAGSALPAAPGALGTFEAFVASLLRTFGAGEEQAFAYALSVHMVMFLAVTGLGLALLYRIGFSLADFPAPGKDG